MKTATTTKFKETELGPIPEGWGVLNVGKIGRVVTGKTPPTSHSEFYGGDYPFVKIPDMTNSVYVVKTETKISEQGAVYLGKAKLPKGSIMVSCIATVGNVGITWEESFTNQQINSLIPDRGVADFKYLYYFFKANKSYLESLGGGGSVYTNISKSKFENMAVIVPSNDEQKQIAEILSSLDDKIELNRAINANLEKLASAIFKKWFIDIGDKLPEGWRVGKLGGEFEIVMGQSPAGDTYKENGRGLPFYQGRTDFGFRFPSRRVYCTEPRRKAKALDTLISVRAPVGDINMALEECCIGRGVGAIRKENLSSYTFYTIKSLQSEISQFDSEGTVFGSINKNSLANISCVVPPKNVVAEFEKIASEIDGQILNLSKEIKNLGCIRDSILPRLMSGKIRLN